MTSFEEAQQKMFWFMPFLMSKRSATGYEGYALFKGTINQAGLALSTESSVQQFQAPISVQSPPILILRDFPLSSLLSYDADAPEAPSEELF
jgi:hypothetical protein